MTEWRIAEYIARCDIRVICDHITIFTMRSNTAYCAKLSDAYLSLLKMDRLVAADGWSKYRFDYWIESLDRRLI